jgi:hypothetical protein
MAEQYKVPVEYVAADMSRAEQVTQMIVEVERNLGLPVGGRPRGRLRGHHAAGAGLVVDDHRLLGLLGHRLAERTRELVGRAAGERTARRR